MSRVYVIVSYDIPNDRRRTRLHKALKDYGIWVQYSLFECKIREQDLVRLRDRIESVINASEDRVSIYRVCADCLKRVERIGSKDPYDSRSLIV